MHTVDGCLQETYIRGQSQVISGELNTFTARLLGRRLRGEHWQHQECLCIKVPGACERHEQHGTLQTYIDCQGRGLPKLKQAGRL